MHKYFNDTGLCIPDRHYMADMSAKTAFLQELIAQGAYFKINRPRQYGKTTLVHLLGLELARDEEYALLELSFEGIGDVVFEEEKSFCQTFVKKMKQEFLFLKLDSLLDGLDEKIAMVEKMDDLSELISDLVDHSPQKLVLSIDEIDKSSNNQLFLSFLGMLRDKFLRRNKGRENTFQSVILVGVHDIKTLKLKLSPYSEDKLNSPWNIAIDFLLDMTFKPSEIAVMLEAYAGNRQIQVDIPEIAEMLFYYTSGYPYLVSKLCKLIDEDILAKKQAKNWTTADVEEGFRLLTYGGYTTTLFESLIKHIENDDELYQFIFDISINGAIVDFLIDLPVLNRAMLYGIIRDDSGYAVIHNRVYEQRLYRYFLSKQMSQKNVLIGHEETGFVKNGQLNIELILLRFQQFMKENDCHKDIVFLEREGRLLFLSFLKPIRNGGGFEFKEPNVAAERRMDIVIVYGPHRYVVELKRWKGEAYHQEGLQQLSAYLDTYSLNQGYLLIFDFRKKKEYKSEHIYVTDKDIFTVWI